MDSSVITRRIIQACMRAHTPQACILTQRNAWFTHAQLTHFPQSSFRIQAWHFIHLTPRRLCCWPCLVGLGEDVAVSSEEMVDAGDSGGVSAETVSRRDGGGVSSSLSWNPSNSSYRTKVASKITFVHARKMSLTQTQIGSPLHLIGQKWRRSS